MIFFKLQHLTRSFLSRKAQVLTKIYETSRFKGNYYRQIKINSDENL